MSNSGPITIKIIASEPEVVAGVPYSVRIETNVPSVVFYTLDGEDPSEDSYIYVSDIIMPGNQGAVTLKVLAISGSNRSPIITQTFGSNFVVQRRPRDKVACTELSSCGSFPFGGSSSDFSPRYLDAGGITTSKKGDKGIPGGYDGTATNNPVNYTDKPIECYDVIYSETNRKGEYGRGIGTLPATVRYYVNKNRENIPDYSEASSPLFDARALVIYQDASKDLVDPDHPLINRPYFASEDTEVVRDGLLKNPAGLQSVTGSMTRQIYNPKDSTMNYSYFDSKTCKWVFSKVPYVAKHDSVVNYSNVVLPYGRGDGSRFVYEWRTFSRRRLL